MQEAITDYYVKSFKLSQSYDHSLGHLNNRKEEEVLKTIED